LEQLRKRVDDLEKARAGQEARFTKVAESLLDMALSMQNTLLIQQQNTERIQHLQALLQTYVAKIEALETLAAGIKKH
jgi:superfamily II RNA helicase